MAPGISHVRFSFQTISSLRFDRQESRETTFPVVSGFKTNDYFQGKFARLGESGELLDPTVRAIAVPETPLSLWCY